MRFPSYIRSYYLRNLASRPEKLFTVKLEDIKTGQMGKTKGKCKYCSRNLQVQIPKFIHLHQLVLLYSLLTQRN